MATKRSGKTGRKQTRREAQIVGDKLRIFDTRFTRQSGEGGRGRERADRSCGDLAALVLVSFDRSRFHRAMKEAERLAPASAAELADAIGLRRHDRSCAAFPPTKARPQRGRDHGEHGRRPRRRASRARRLRGDETAADGWRRGARARV